ncbi:hypothetical protein GUJ93_ZPchr0010g10546 [Zizania palustris]|uniref:Uncharacterized protein n=1 Tax=Zizania palustris TaxID=103762 RepID=A0A8J6BLJ3_ZIZPA|nr:hypothetical protein GUJ93_ZPchr0010g10546 [Zizania palustris]
MHSAGRGAHMASHGPARLPIVIRIAREARGGAGYRSSSWWARAQRTRCLAGCRAARGWAADRESDRMEDDVSTLPARARGHICLTCHPIDRCRAVAHSRGPWPRTARRGAAPPVRVTYIHANHRRY